MLTSKEISAGWPRCVPVWTVAVGLVLLSASVAEGSAPRWTRATPDEMVDELLARAGLGGDDALAALVVASALDDRASAARVRDGLLAIARSSSPLADEALWLGLRLSPDARAVPWSGMGAAAFGASPDAQGLVKAFAIIGPFQDTAGDGVTRHEGPEAPGHNFADMSAHYAWGVYDVPVRRVLPSSASARGVPLDLYVYPRSETCTYLASRVTVPQGQKPFFVWVAASGAVRLIWDAQDVAISEEVHARLVLDRLGVRVDASPGDHLLAVKVCTAAAFDEGRPRAFHGRAAQASRSRHLVGAWAPT